jgi:hypothetical protein
MRTRAIAFAAIVVGSLAGVFSMSAQQSTEVIPVDRQVIVSLLSSIAKHTARLTPLLEPVHAKDWEAKGAPATYATQLTSARAQIGAIDTDMDSLAQHPERMQDCLRALFRVQSFHRSLDSLMGGLRKYQNPALADLIQSVAVEDQEDLAKFQDYILELANQREQEYLVVDHEAQRCRASISREPVSPRKK